MSYQRSAPFIYDAIYTDMKDYAEEARRICELFYEYKQTGETSAHEYWNTALDVACGTGLHAEHLSKSFFMQALDLSAEMLEVAKRRAPRVEFHQGDMTDFDLRAAFDLITCLFSAIGHLTSIEQLHAAISCMAKHLKRGGVLMVEPWIHPDMYIPGHLRVDEVQTTCFKVVRVPWLTRHGNLTHLEMHHFVSRDGAVEHFVEHHELAMYTVEEYMQAFRAAGLEVWHNEEGLMGRGLFIGRKPL